MHSHNWQRGMAWSVAYSASSISQSSGTSGSSSAGVEDVAGWAGEVVDGARISVREKEQDGRMGSLLASAKGKESGSENGRVTVGMTLPWG